MPGWKDVSAEVRSGSAHDIVRRKYLRDVYELTGRNTIYYYPAWLEKANLIKQGLVSGFDVNDSDKNGFMAAIQGLDRTKGLDLILHTPGGDAAATESLVEYLRAMFGTDIRVIVPHLAMSAGTMIALSARSIVMGKHSSLGPVDPQIFGMPAHAVVEEFNRARVEMMQNPINVALWQPIVGKYPPTLIGECEKAIKWSQQMVRSWLSTGMFKDEDDAQVAIDMVMKELGDHASTGAHNRHIGIDKAKEIGLKIEALEERQEFQEAVLTAHHSYVATANETGAVKIIENHEGVAHLSVIQFQLQAASGPQQSQPQ